MYYVYAIYNSDNDKIYIGQTNDISRRLLEHNSSSAHFTGRIVGKWELIYLEMFTDRSSAIAREKELKTHRGRDFIRKQIKSNPE